MRKIDKTIEIPIECSKDEFLQGLNEYNHRYEYVRVSQHKDYEVCLELTWRQHTEPFVQYCFVGSIEEDKLVGEIVKPLKEVKEKRVKTTWKEKFEIAGIIAVMLTVIIGVPFLIAYLISHKIFLSIFLGLIPLIGLYLLSLFDDGNIAIHKENINDMVQSIK